MNVRNLIVGTLSVAFVAFAAFAADDIKLEGIKCVMNPKGAARAEQSVAYKGGKVYFCCENCPKSFDATKNAVAANHQLLATKQAKQEKCPISGQALSPDHKLTLAGTEVAFCCPNCKGKVASAAEDAKLKLVFSNEAFDKAFKVEKK